MLMARRNLADLDDRATLIAREAKYDMVSHIVIWLTIGAICVTWCVDFGLHYNIEINNLNRFAILIWSIVVCFMLILTSCCLLAQVDKHYSRNVNFVRYTRMRIMSILGVLVFAYLYRIGFYTWYIFGANTDPMTATDPKVQMRYMLIGSFMYIFGEGLPLVVIFVVHWFKFVRGKEVLDAKVYFTNHDSN